MELHYFLSWTCAPGICPLWGVFSSFSCNPPNILVHFPPNIFLPFSSQYFPPAPVLFLCYNPPNFLLLFQFLLFTTTTARHSFSIFLSDPGIPGVRSIFSSHFLPNIFLPLPFSSSATIHPIFFSCSDFSYSPSLLLDIHSAYFYHVVRHFCNLICCCVFSSQLTCFLPSVKQKECLECLALSSRTVIAWDKKVELVFYLIY